MMEIINNIKHNLQELITNVDKEVSDINNLINPFLLSLNIFSELVINQQKKNKNKKTINTLIQHSDGKIRYKDIVLADKGFVISLPHRLDRREDVKKVLYDLNITGWSFENGVVFDEQEWYRWGCTQAFVNIFKKALDNNYDSIIIFEDDVKKTNVSDITDIDSLFNQWDEQVNNYDLIALGTRPMWDYPIKVDSNHFGTINHFLCAQAFYYKKDFIKYAYEKLKCFKNPSCPHYKDIIDCFLSDCSSDVHKHSHMGVNSKVFRTGITIPMVFTQGPSYSDNERTFVNYEGWIEDSFWNTLNKGKSKE